MNSHCSCSCSLSSPNCFVARLELRSCLELAMCLIHSPRASWCGSHLMAALLVPASKCGVRALAGLDCWLVIITGAVGNALWCLEGLRAKFAVIWTFSNGSSLGRDQRRLWKRQGRNQLCRLFP